MRLEPVLLAMAVMKQTQRQMQPAGTTHHDVRNKTLSQLFQRKPEATSVLSVVLKKDLRPNTGTQCSLRTRT